MRYTIIYYNKWQQLLNLKSIFNSFQLIIPLRSIKFKSLLTYFFDSMNILNFSSDARLINSIIKSKNAPSKRTPSPINACQKPASRVEEGKKIEIKNKKNKNQSKCSNTPSPIVKRDNSSDSKNRRQSNSINKKQNSNHKLESFRNRKFKVFSEAKDQNLLHIRQQLVELKGDYQRLKASYTTLLQQKQNLIEQLKLKQQEALQSKGQLVKQHRIADIHNHQLKFFKNQLQRIKRQCAKLLQLETYKNKRLNLSLKAEETYVKYLQQLLAVNQIQIQRRTPFFSLNEDPEKQNSELISLHSLLTTENKTKQIRSLSESYDSLNFSNDQLKQTHLQPLSNSTRQHIYLQQPMCPTFCIRDNFKSIRQNKKPSPKVKKLEIKKQRIR